MGSKKATAKKAPKKPAAKPRRRAATPPPAAIPHASVKSPPERGETTVPADPQPPTADTLAPGRPSDLTPVTREAILEKARLGTSREACAAAGRISLRTLQRWLARGRRKDGDEEYRHFRQAFLKAESDGEVGLVAILHRNARQRDDIGASTRAASFLLERRFRKRWGRQEKLTHAVDKSAPAVFELDVSSPVQRRQQEGTEAVATDEGE